MRNGMLFVSVALFSACNPSKATLLRGRVVEAGTQCPSGGVAIETGKDTNDNGVLDDGEVNGAQTTYVCDGRAGDAGINGLSVTSSEPRGDHCPSGGVRIDSGLDLDSSGTLSVGEVTSTQYVCNPSVPVVYYGDLTIRSAADVAVLAGVEVMTGTLTIVVSPTPELTFPALRIIAGGLSLIDQSCGECSAPSTGVKSLSLPALTQLGSLDCTARELVSFSAPKLARVGSMSILNNGALVTLAFDQLVSAEDISVTSNQVLTTLSLPRLVRTSALNVSSNPALLALSTPVLTSVVSQLSVDSNSSLPLCAVQQLVSRLRIDPFNFSSVNANATTACVPAEVCDLWPIDGLGTLRFCGWPLDLAAARAACQTLGAGADLAWFTSDAEWLAFKAKTLKYQTTSWIGYSDEATEGTWLALNGFSAYSPTSRPDFWQSGAAPVDAAHALNGAVVTLGTVTDAATTSTASGFICRVQ